MRRSLVGSVLLLLAACAPGRTRAVASHRWVDWEGTRALVAGGIDGRGSGEGPVLVYLHGYASHPYDQLPLSDNFDVPIGTRFVFPEAPLPVEVPREGVMHAWFPIDYGRRRALRQERNGLRELAGDRPAGLARARAALAAVRRGVERELGAPWSSVLLLGFSQGAIVALDATLEDDGPPPAGLALLSGSPRAGAAWRPRLPRLRGTPVFMTHGTHDDRLPFALAERLAADLAEAGVPLWWMPHEEGHHMTEAFMPVLTRFANRVLTHGDLRPDLRPF
jgi:phospholipase/carboxylesterase